MHRALGAAILIGMTAMPEGQSSRRQAEIPLCRLVALVTDYDCWKLPPAGEHPPGAAHSAAELLQEIIANLRSASDNGIALIRRAVDRTCRRPEVVADCRCRVLR